MEFGFSKEEEAFRQEVRAFLAGVATPEVVAEADSGQGWGPHTWKFVQALGSRQWLTPTWPKEYGGLALPPMYRFIIHEEIDFTGALKPEALIVGANIAGPTIIAYGSDKQKKEFLPRIARGEIEFAIGYTEPQAGSDLGSLQMRAEDKGDHFVFNGQKVFNTRCHFAQYHWIVARTDPAAPKHRGISLFIVDMKTPGITVRPLYGLDGIRTNEVYYDNVIVPREGLVGEQNKGFGYTMSALEFERVLTVGTLTRNFQHLVNYVKSQPSLRQDSLGPPEDRRDRRRDRDSPALQLPPGLHADQAHCGHLRGLGLQAVHQRAVAAHGRLGHGDTRAVRPAAARQQGRAHGRGDRAPQPRDPAEHHRGRHLGGDAEHHRHQGT